MSLLTVVSVVKGVLHQVQLLRYDLRLGPVETFRLGLSESREFAWFGQDSEVLYNSLALADTTGVAISVNLISQLQALEPVVLCDVTFRSQVVQEGFDVESASAGENSTLTETDRLKGLERVEGPGMLPFAPKILPQFPVCFANGERSFQNTSWRN